MDSKRYASRKSYTKWKHRTPQCGTQPITLAGPAMSVQVPLTARPSGHDGSFHLIRKTLRTLDLSANPKLPSTFIIRDSLTLFSVIFPLSCAWEVDSKHGIFKGLNFGIFQGSKWLTKNWQVSFRVCDENFRRAPLPPLYWEDPPTHIGKHRISSRMTVGQEA